MPASRTITGAGSLRTWRRFITWLGMFSLAACSAMPSPQQTVSRLNQRFTGQNASEFFDSYGEPAGKTASKNIFFYRWVSIEPQETDSGPAYHSYPAPGGQHIPILEPGHQAPMEPQYCELRIQANKKDVIRHISIVHDGAGKYSNSLCSEIFRQE